MRFGNLLPGAENRERARIHQPSLPQGQSGPERRGGSSARKPWMEMESFRPRAVTSGTARGSPRFYVMCKGRNQLQVHASQGKAPGEQFATRPDSPAGWTRWIEVIVHQSVFTAAAFCVFCMRLHFPKIAYAQAHPRIVSSCAKWGPQLGGHKL